MARLTCSRNGWGAVDHPETGELIQLDEPHPNEVAEIVAHHYDSIRVLYDGDSDERGDEDYNCGVNGCSRTVDNPDETCWQHPTDS